MVSPWTCLGHAAFTAMRHRRGAAVRYPPANLSTVFPSRAGCRLPSAIRCGSNTACWNCSDGASDAPWPFDPALADAIVMALVGAGGDPKRFLPAAFAAIWEQERNLADPETLSELLHGGALMRTVFWPMLGRTS